MDDNNNDGTSIERKAPGLPKYVCVDIGKDYTGPPFFDLMICPKRCGWIPILPITVEEHTPSNHAVNQYDDHSRSMLPLQLAWAWTILKAQGQTIPGKLVLNLLDDEREHRLTYVAFSQ
jgi:hypothetical protein